MVGMMNLRTNILRKNSHITALDRTDIAILGLLQNDARLSVKEIAAEVGLAPSSTHERIRRMWDAGVLRGTHVEVDPRVLGIGLEALFMIELSKHERGAMTSWCTWPSATHSISRTLPSTGSQTGRASTVSKRRSSSRRAAATNCLSSKSKIEGRV